MIHRFPEMQMVPEHALDELKKELQVNQRLARLLAVYLYRKKESIVSASYGTTDHALLVGLTQSASTLAKTITELTANIDLL